MAHIVNEGNLKQELEDYKHEYTPEAKNDCKEGEYFCNDEQKCKSFRRLSCNAQMVNL